MNIILPLPPSKGQARSGIYTWLSDTEPMEKEIPDMMAVNGKQICAER